MGQIRPVNLNALDLNLVRVLDALIRERSVTRAGERIGLSQPAVSAALTRLRHALNDQLFIRRGNDMIPTPRAEDLAEPVRAALAGIERAFEASGAFEPGRMERTFTLMGADFFSLLFMPSLAGRVQSIAPRVSLRLRDSAAGDVARMLLDDAIDIALERPLDLPEWVSSLPLFRSPFAVIIAREHPAAKALGLKDGDTMPLDTFCGLDHVIRSIDGSMRGFTDDALERMGRQRRIVLGLPHFHAVAASVAKGRLTASVPVQYAQAVAADLGLIVCRPPLDIAVPEIRAYWHARHDDDRPHRWLREQIVAEVAALNLTDTGGY